MTPPLSVGLNLVYLVEESGGSGTYARELIRSMLTVEPETRMTLFVAESMPPSLRAEPWADSVRWIRFRARADGPPWHIVHQLALLPVLAVRRRLDVVHGLANIVPPVAPRVATVDTLLDVTWLHYPETMSRRATLAMRALAPLCARRADRVIAISHAAKDDIAASLGLDPRKVDVTPLGIRLEQTAPPVAGEALRQQFGLADGPVVLSVAQKREHKNLARLIRAIAASDVPGLQLVLPGSPTPYEEELRQLAVDLCIEDRVYFPAWLSEEELEGLYGLARCFVLPSLAEGFGLPVLEAMRRGVPVACSNVSSLPEVAGDAALLFPPEDVGAIAAAIARLVRDDALAEDLVRRGHQRCREFTWERTARETLASYRRAVDTVARS